MLVWSKIDDACLISINDTQFLVDCPKQQVNVQIHGLLISSYKSIWLPLITEYSDFDGPIYTTLPTMELLRLAMLEYVLNTRTHNQSHQEQLELLYDEVDIENAIAKIKPIGYHDPQIIHDVQVRAVSQGVMLGASNWVFNTPDAKIVYLTGISLMSDYLMPMDTVALQDAQVALIAPMPLESPSTDFAAMWPKIERKLEQKQTILVPTDSFDEMYHRIELFSQHLGSRFPELLLHVKSPIGKSSLQYSLIFSEWLSAERVANVMQAKPCLLHGDLIANLKLIVHDSFESLSRLPTPRIIFCNLTDGLGDFEHLSTMFPNVNVLHPHPTDGLYYQKPRTTLSFAVSFLKSLNIESIQPTLERKTLEIARDHAFVSMPHQVLHLTLGLEHACGSSHDTSNVRLSG
ncbi:beta-lactamase-like protein [Gorgonomyces haynaldii]|nr:beta-lactamase-like protein [Gorgonomyces haynaldii]